MSNEGDPVTVTLRLAQWRVVESALTAWDAGTAFPVRDFALRTIRQAMDPVPAPDPRAPIKAPDPRRTKPWPELKSSQDADNAGA